MPPSIETAAVATGTALAELDAAVAATATALALTAAPPDSSTTPTIPLWTFLLAAGLVAALGFSILAGLLIVRSLRLRRQPPDAPPTA